MLLHDNLNDKEQQKTVKKNFLVASFRHVPIPGNAAFFRSQEKKQKKKTRNRKKT